MNHFAFDNDWDVIKGQLKHRYGQLTDDDLTLIEGKGTELFARLRQKLGLSAINLDAVLHELREVTGGKLDEVKANLGEVADDARATAGAALSDLKAKASKLGDEAKAQTTLVYEHARTLCENGDEYVRQNPGVSLLAATCLGFVTGLLLRR